MSSSNSQKKYKIVCLLMPFWGHLNPLSGMINELINKYGADILIYGNIENKKLIESTGATFKLYPYYPTTEYMLQVAKDKNEDVMEVMIQLYLNFFFYNDFVDLP